MTDLVHLCPQASVILCIAEAVADISVALRTTDFDQEHAGSTNSFGDDQLQVWLLGPYCVSLPSALPLAAYKVPQQVSSKLQPLEPIHKSH